MKEAPKHYTKEEITNRENATKLIKTKKLQSKPPEWLNDEAKNEWKEILKQTKGFEIFMQSDLNILAMYCDTISHLKILTKILYEKQFYFTYDGKGNKILTEDVKLIQALNSQLLKYSDKLGLNPMSRNRIATSIGNQESKKTKGEFDI